ncbi:MAG: urease accessory protein UreF [Betaproteobacteria bacterium]
MCATHCLLAQLQLVVVRAEWPAVARAHAAFQAHDPSAVEATNDWVLHTRESRELRLQAEQMGRSLVDWLGQRHPQEPRVQCLRDLRPAPTWPVAFGLAGVLANAELHDVLMAHGFSWAENQVQAAIKSSPSGQSAGQRVLQTNRDAMPAAIQACLTMPAEQAQAYAPGLAIHSARHEQQYSRLFRS